MASEQIPLFTGSPDAKLELVAEGAHYLNATNARAVNAAVVAMVQKYGA